MNSDLTVDGIEQATTSSTVLFTHMITDTNIFMFETSLNRAKDTAKIMNEDLQIPTTFHDELKEVNR
jgi:broad specificity phosphatase PhoE